MADVPTSFESFYNPITDIITEYADEIALADELAAHYVGEADLQPSEILGVLAKIDVNEIRNQGARVHHRAQQVYESLTGADFQSLLTDSWQGTDADTFEDYMVGGRGHRGLNLYLEEVKTKTESHAMAFIDLGEQLKESLTARAEEIRSILNDVRDQVYEAEALGGGSIWKDILLWVGGIAAGGGAAIMISAGAAVMTAAWWTGIGAIIAIALIVIGLICLAIGLLIDEVVSEADQMQNAAKALMGDMNAVADNAEPSLPSEQVDEELSAAQW